MIMPILAAGGASIGFAVLYGVPAILWSAAGVVGGLAWAAVLVSQQGVGLGPVPSLLLGAAVAALLAELLARWYHKPVTMFLVPGIIPLVPGGRAYVTMLHFLQGDATNGLNALLETVFAAGAIAVGMILISSIFRVRSK